MDDLPTALDDKENPEEPENVESFAIKIEVDEEEGVKILPCELVEFQVQDVTMNAAMNATMNETMDATINETMNETMDENSLQEQVDSIDKAVEASSLPRTRKRNFKWHMPSEEMTNGEDADSNSKKSEKRRKVLKNDSKKKQKNDNKKKQVKKGGVKKLKTNKCGRKVLPKYTSRKQLAKKRKAGKSNVDNEETGITNAIEGPSLQDNNDDGKKETKHKFRFGIITCPVCKKILSTQSSLKRHRRSAGCLAEKTKLIDKEDSLRDEEKFDIEVPLELQFEVPKEPRTCNECQRVLSSPANLKRHISSVHCLEKPKVEYKYSCTFEGCTMRFSLPSYRKKHYDAVHLNIRKFLCDICSQMFKTTNALKTHLRTQHVKHRDKAYIFACPVCKREFSNKFKLQAHETVHTNVKPFMCDKEGCGKTFRLKDTLKKHLQSHQNYKPYKCEICEQSFTRKIYLETHQYKHTGVKMFKCTLCEKSFSQKGNLYVHLKAHGKLQKQYKCKLCDKVYMMKQSLVHHRRVHHGVQGEDSDYESEEKPEIISEDETPKSDGNNFFSETLVSGDPVVSKFEQSYLS